MNRWNRVQRQVFESVMLVSEKERIIEELRKDLNH
jgi:hypothetical protein